jgi:hypothetical protein
VPQHPPGALTGRLAVDQVDPAIDQRGGIALGALSPWIVDAIAGDDIPLPMVLGIYPIALLKAFVLTLLAAGVSAAGGLALVLGALVLLSCVGRAALFALPAVIVPKRALVASVGVAIVVEYLAGFLPAVVNQFTVSLRLRSLLVHWMGWRMSLPPDLRMIVDPEPPWVQFAAVIALATLLLAAAGVILAWRQFPPAEES